MQLESIINAESTELKKLEERAISIFIAHDGNEIWTYVHSLLEDCGYAVSGATDGRQALQTVAEVRPNLVIVGEDLCDISGLEWIIKVRQQNSSCRLLFVSNSWRNAEFYNTLKRDYAVSLIVHRPFKPSLFTLQIESLFTQPECTESSNLVEHENFERHLALKLRYAKLLPLRLQQLAEVIGLSKRNRQQRHLSEALRLAHNMKSCARSCGLKQIGQAAGIIENCIGKILSGSETEAQWRLVDESLSNMNAQILAIEDKYMDETDLEEIKSLEDASKAVVLFASGSPLRTQIVDNGVCLVHANDHESALYHAQSKQIDGALIDLSLAGSRQDAICLANSIRGIPGLENLPLGFIGSGMRVDDHLEATRAGGSVFLQNDPTSEDLKRAANYLCTIRQGGRPRVLLVDDDPDYCQIISSALAGQGMQICKLNDPSKLMAKLQEFTPDLILLDVLMPVINGYDVCRQLRSLRRWQDIPIVIVTAHSGADARINAFEAGADDYLPKPIIEMELISRIKLRLERAKLIRERADKDLLTGLLSRRAFTDQMTALVAESSRHQFSFCVSFIDVDHFKKVNDEHGHQAGDEVLANLGQLFARRFRVEDLRARWGGEEFALAFPHSNSSVMRSSLHRVLDEFRNTVFEDEHKELFNVSFSAGMATFPNDGRSMKELLQCADQRLYIAKSLGRNAIVTTD